MPRKPNRPKKNELIRISVEIPGAMAVKLDARAKTMKYTRSGAVRVALSRYLREG